MKPITHVFLAFLFLMLVSCNKDSIKIACIGDSITAGAGHSNQSKTAYPAILDGILGESYSVLNCGRSGATLMKDGNLPYWNCKEFYNVFTYEPDVIIIKLGTNDTKPKNWNAISFEKDYQALIDTLGYIQGKPEIYLCLPVPAYRSAWGINDSTLTAGVIPAINKIAKTNNLPVIDLYDSMGNQPENFPDGIHPNVEGARNMAVIVAGELD